MKGYDRGRGAKTKTVEEAHSKNGAHVSEGVFLSGGGPGSGFIHLDARLLENGGCQWEGSGKWLRKWIRSFGELSNQSRAKGEGPSKTCLEVEMGRSGLERPHSQDTLNHLSEPIRQ